MSLSVLKIIYNFIIIATIYVKTLMRYLHTEY